LDDADTRAAVTAERALLAALERAVSAPVGAIAEVVESIDEDGRVFEEVSLRGCVAMLDGSDVIRASVSDYRSGTRARALGGRGVVRTRARDLLPRLGEIDDWAFRARRKPKPGRITFVGAGPGDPGLLTTRARSVLANAALVFTDPTYPKRCSPSWGSELPPASGP